MNEQKPEKAKRGRPPKPLPLKADGTTYTPKEIARLITTTTP